MNCSCGYGVDRDGRYVAFDVGEIVNFVAFPNANCRRIYREA